MTARLGVLRELDAAGVELRTQIPGALAWVNSEISLSPDEAAELLRLGPDKFWPRYLETTPQIWKHYLAFMGNGRDVRCTAKNKAGGECGTYMDPYSVPLPPEFTPGVHDRCKWHRGK